MQDTINYIFIYIYIYTHHTISPKQPLWCIHIIKQIMSIFFYLLIF